MTAERAQRIPHFRVYIINKLLIIILIIGPLTVSTHNTTCDVPLHASPDPLVSRNPIV